MPAQQQGQQQGQQISWVSMLLQFGLIYLCFSYMNPFKGVPDKVVENIENVDPIIEVEGQEIPDSKPAQPTGSNFRNIFAQGSTLRLKMFLVDGSPDSATLIHERDVVLGSFADDQYETVYKNISLSPNLLNNGSAMICSVFSKKDVGNNFAAIASQPESKLMFRECLPMIVYKRQKKFIEKQNLITGEFDKPDLSFQAASEDAELEIVSFWKPNVTLSVVDEFRVYSPNTLPAQLKQHFRFYKDGHSYFPIVYYNEFWLLSENLMAINNTLDALPLTINIEPLSEMKFLLYEQFSQSMEMQRNFGSSDKDIDDVKMMLYETNPILLGITVVVTLLHTVFDILAFKNDISYWKNKKSMVGMSVRSIFMNTISQIIVFLYLLDNDTSFMILVSVGVGIFIEFWKITKAVNVKLDRSSSIPRIRFEDKESYSSVTKQYDEQAFRILGYALFPLVIGYSIYSLYFETHKSWYSWVLASLTGCVYTFGFIMMTPQLFINYKLKSVAHLPWRTFTYKALNTFIDDLFAFIIRMPTLHRLACFRDDIVFFIFLFQWYLYPKDKRRNEYGEILEEDEPKESENSDKSNKSEKAEKSEKPKKKENVETISEKKDAKSSQTTKRKKKNKTKE